MACHGAFFILIPLDIRLHLFLEILDRFFGLGRLGRLQAEPCTRADENCRSLKYPSPSRELIFRWAGLSSKQYPLPRQFLYLP